MRLHSAVNFSLLFTKADQGRTKLPNKKSRDYETRHNPLILLEPGGGLNPRPADYESIIIPNSYNGLRAERLKNKELEFSVIFMNRRLFSNRLEQIWSTNLTLITDGKLSAVLNIPQNSKTLKNLEQIWSKHCAGENYNGNRFLCL